MSFKPSSTFIITLFLVAFLSSSFDVSATDIEQITVSSTRQNSRLSDVTSNLTALNQKQIELVQAEHINQTLSRVAGTWISRGNGQEHLTAIRSPVLTGAGGCGAFFIAQDGISVRAPGFCNTNQLFDLNTEQASQIEVIRGPSSVFYGSNAVHGVINLITPSVSGLSPLSVAIDAGPHDYLRSKFSFSKQHDQHSFGFYGNVSQDGGYKNDSGYDQQKLNFVHNTEIEGWSFKNVFAVSNLNQETAGFVRGFEAYTDPVLKTQNPNPEAFRDNQTMRLYSKIEKVGDDGTRFSITPYLRWAEMTFLQHFLPWQPTETNAQRSFGLQTQFEQQHNDFTIVTGFDLDMTRGELSEIQENEFSASIPAGQHYDYHVDASVLSPFGIVTWQLTDALLGNVGARYEYTSYDYNNRLSDGSACAPEVDDCRFTRPQDQEVTYKEWSYHAGANYQIAPKHRLYGQISRGYRAPQATELFRLQAGQQITDLDAETIDAIEVGLRGTTDSLFYDVTLFDMEKDNFIFQDTNRQNISDGKTSHQGVEVSVNLALDENWYVAANGTLAKHQYKSDLGLSRTPIFNNEIDTAPEHLASVQVGWQSDAGHSFEIDWVHQGNYYLDPQNTASYEGHKLINLRARFQLNSNLSFGARVVNLTDVDYAERADFAFGAYRYFVGEPRAVYLTIHYRQDH